MLNVCVFASCSKTLDYADVTSEHRMMRYLYSIEEYLLPNTYYPEGRKLMYFIYYSHLLKQIIRNS